MHIIIFTILIIILNSFDLSSYDIYNTDNIIFNINTINYNKNNIIYNTSNNIFYINIVNYYKNKNNIYNTNNTIFILKLLIIVQI